MILVKKLSETAIIPTQAHPGDAGLDLYADEDVTLEPGDWELVKTHIAMALPKGTFAMVCPRSGLAMKHGVTVLNAPGIVDNGYRDGIGVVLINYGSVPFLVHKGMRIAQLVIMAGSVTTSEPVEFVEVDDLSETARNLGGFGSTGI